MSENSSSKNCEPAFSSDKAAHAKDSMAAGAYGLAAGRAKFDVAIEELYNH
jgi:hypothetical protein